MLFTIWTHYLKNAANVSTLKKNNKSEIKNCTVATKIESSVFISSTFLCSMLILINTQGQSDQLEEIHTRLDYNWTISLRLSHLYSLIFMRRIYYFDTWAIIWHGIACWFMVSPRFSQFLFVVIIKLFCTDMKIKTKTI